MKKKTKGAKARRRRARRAFLWLLFTLAALALLARLIVFEPVRMESAALAPAYQKGDVVIASKLELFRGWNVSRGDAVLADFESAGGKLIRRAQGLPGDRIDVDENGNKFLVYVNGDGGEARLSLGSAPALVYGRLPEGAYLLLADDNTCEDSRTLGLVYETDIKAKAGRILWPLSRAFQAR